ncbi:MAG: SUF system NifU family Fe-S cluster assembly protein [Candidatus Micrarchaeaceae archaeon]
MELDMYAEELLRHYEHPDNNGEIANPSAKMHEENISCGDRIDIYIEIEGGKIKDIKFQGSGCVISMGTASMLTDEVKGKSLQEVEKMDKGKLIKLIGVDPGPVRMHCATLSLRAIKKAVFEYEKKPVDTATKEL